MLTFDKARGVLAFDHGNASLLLVPLMAQGFGMRHLVSALRGNDGTKTITKACCNVSRSRTKRKRDQRNGEDADPVTHRFVPHLALSLPRPSCRDDRVDLFALTRRLSSHRKAELDIRAPAVSLKRCLAPQSELDGRKAF